MSDITAGNAKEEGREFRFWIVGRIEDWCREKGIAFDRERYGLRNSDEIEIKWGSYNKGDVRNEWAPCSDRTAMSILIRGDCIFTFRKAEDHGNIKEVRVKQEGDYIIWNENMEHIWRMLDDSEFLTLRWLSKDKR